MKNKNYIYWAIAIVGAYLIYKWWSKKNAPKTIVAPAETIIPPAPTESDQGSGSGTDQLVTKTTQVLTV